MNPEWILVRHKTNPNVLFWIRDRGDYNTFDVRSPVNALGFGSEDEEGIPSPDRSAHCGIFSAEAIEKYYVEAN